MFANALPFFGAALLSIASSATGQVVHVAGGSIRGTAQDGGALFRGIPFAAPPLASLRWKRPQPVRPWPGVRDATAPAPACLQNDHGWNRSDFLTGREDCLTLDVGTPSLSGRHPVLVWIHGGSNRAGSPDGMTLSPVGKDVVLVGVRYRLGIFGFLSHPELTAEQGASGNYGLMDQLAALEWVKRNIARFGGDPANVTIAGESAGAQDVGLLIAAPAGRHLFHKAIMESGTPGFGLPFRTRAAAEQIGQQADDLLGSKGDLAVLRRVSVPALLAVDRELHDDALESDEYMWLRTTIDGAVLPRSPRELVQEAPPRPLIIGTNRIELDLPGGRPHRDAFIKKAFEENSGRARALYESAKASRVGDPRSGSLDQQIATDVTFRCPAVRMAQIFAARGAPVWHYEFDAAPGGGPTTHAAEIPFIFGTEKFGREISLRPYWVQFARTGDPNSAGMPAWPRFTAAAPAHAFFDGTGVSPRGALRPEYCSLIDRL